LALTTVSPFNSTTMRSRSAVIRIWFHCPAGFIACCVGSLSRARLRPAARDDALVLERPLEIVSLSGTLSVDGPHLHMAVSDDAGAVTGGHVLEGCRVRTTAELVLAFAEGVRFARAPDPATGYAELRVEPVRR
jgi:predicted DNA-binding protein with PD1-like motif